MSCASTAQAIAEHRSAIAAALVELASARRPQLAARYAPLGPQKSLHDAGLHLAFLAQALELDCNGLFTDHVAWARVVLASRQLPPEDLVFHLRCTAEVLGRWLSPAQMAEAGACLQAGIDAIEGGAGLPPSPLDGAAPLAADYLQAMLGGDRIAAVRLLLDARAAGWPLQGLYLQVLAPAMQEVGRLWQTARITAAQEHACAAITQLAMAQLLGASSRARPQGRTVLAACVAGEHHDIGARMVADCFELAGWRALQLGANTPSADLIRLLLDQRADVLALSVTCAPQLHEARALVAALRALPETAGVVVLAGGLTLNAHPGLWRKLGVDGHAPDAVAAVAEAERLLRARTVL